MSVGIGLKMAMLQACWNVKGSGCDFQLCETKQNKNYKKKKTKRKENYACDQFGLDQILLYF